MIHSIAVNWYFSRPKCAFELMARASAIWSRADFYLVELGSVGTVADPSVDEEGAEVHGWVTGRVP